MRHGVAARDARPSTTVVAAHVALSTATTAMMGFSLAFTCAWEDGSEGWTWPAAFSTEWMIVVVAVAAAAWGVVNTALSLSRPCSPRGVTAATVLVALTLGCSAVAAFVGPDHRIAVQLWIVCAMNLAYQAVGLRRTR
ncbi:hypothetical protein [Rhodococcus sp. HNM0569]|uniref:hypothetical protein n=1 Tax=Rhodococcus sp. HNM0569 TaxID=2716340 RepID=UPI00146C8EE0|nr:hypothetical protein [Rhodococcus sp. HNM0569]NLU82667.1 hypothetical protein [Rhodococcus sp. HNM0569]